jgi:hypothetical protein
MACLFCSPLRTIRAGWAVPVAAISLPRCCASCCALGSTPTLFPPIAPIGTRLSSASTARLVRSACACSCHRRLSKCKRPQSAFCLITTKSDPIKRVRVAISRLRSPLPPFRHSRPSLRRLIRIGFLERVSGQAFGRKVQSDASLTINLARYYVPRDLAGQQVACFINAPEKQFAIWQAGVRVRSVPIKGLSGRTVPFEEYVELMKQEARSEYRRYLHTHPRLTQGRLWA